MSDMPDEIWIGTEWAQVGEDAYIKCNIASHEDGLTRYTKHDPSKVTISRERLGGMLTDTSKLTIGQVDGIRMLKAAILNEEGE